MLRKGRIAITGHQPSKQGVALSEREEHVWEIVWVEWCGGTTVGSEQVGGWAGPDLAEGLKQGCHL